jgi:hypothetical protein
VADGSRGELTVLVDGLVAAKKNIMFLPAVEQVLAAIREPAAAEESCQ